MGIIAKSVIFDIENNHNDSDYVAVRQINFYLDSLITITPSDYTTYSTTNSVSYDADNAFDTSLSNTGADTTSWMSSSSSITNQRLIIVFNDETEFNDIKIINYHNSGLDVDRGAYNIKILTSSGSVTDTTYGSNVTGSIELNTIGVDPHSQVDEENEIAIYEYFITSDIQGGKVSIKIDGQSSELTDFPVLINLCDNAGKLGFNFDDVFDELKPTQRSVLNSQPTSNWIMDNISGTSLIDEKGNYDGVITNMTNDVGQFDKCLIAGQVASVIRKVEFPVDVGFKTASFWIRRHTTAATSNIFMKGGIVLAIQVSGSGNYVYFYNGGPKNSNLVVEDTLWHNVVIVEGTNSNYHRIYIDGVKSSAEVNSGIAGSFRMFGRSNSVSNQEVTDLDNVKIFDYKLTDYEVMCLYNESKYKFGKIRVDDVNSNQCFIEVDNVDIRYSDNLKLLIQSDTQNNSTYFEDHSENRHPISANGDAKHSTAQHKFDDSSMLFDGSGDYIYVNDSNDFDSNGGDFTIDYWMYPLNVTSRQMMCGQSNSGASSIANTFEITTSSTIKFWQTVSNTIESSTTITINEWCHIAAVYLSSTITLYINGTNVGSVAQAADTVQGSGYAIGRSGDYNGLYYNGYVDEFRIHKGVGLWDGNFTPPGKTNKISSAQLYVKVPTIPISGTNLTLYYDKSKSDNTAYVGEVGTVPAVRVWDENFVGVYHMTQDPIISGQCILDSTTVMNGTPYGSMTSDDLVRTSIGKGIHFDNTDDYIELSDNDYNNITVEAVIDTSISSSAIIGRDDASAGNRVYQFRKWGGNLEFICFSGGSNTIVQSSSIPDSCYCAGTFDGTTITTYVDGNEDGTGSLSGNLDSGTNYTYIGLITKDSTALRADRIISEVRISNISRTQSWISGTKKALSDDLLTFSVTTFTYNSSPINSVKMYGIEQLLKSVVSVSGSESSYTYDATFYLGGEFVSTISGTDSGNEVSQSIPTLSGTTYSWYIETTSSGATDRSPDYDFYVRYLCSGICTDGGPASGVEVILYNRRTKEQIGTTTTAGDGVFEIDSQYNEEHYAVALHPNSNTNALIYDRLKP